MKFNDLVEGRITKSHSWFALVIQEEKIEKSESYGMH